MSIVALTRVYEQKKDYEECILIMCTTSDGYPQYHGKKLAKFLKGMKIIKGIPLEKNPGKAANGMGCLAAQLIAKFKRTIGETYIVNSEGHGEEYIYDIKYINKNLKLILHDIYENTETSFDSSEKFLEFLKKDKQK